MSSENIVITDDQECSGEGLLTGGVGALDSGRLTVRAPSESERQISYGIRTSASAMSEDCQAPQKSPGPIQGFSFHINVRPIEV